MTKLEAFLERTANFETDNPEIFEFLKIPTLLEVIRLQEEALDLALWHVQEGFPEEGPIEAAKYIGNAKKEIEKLLEKV